MAVVVVVVSHVQRIGREKICNKFLKITSSEKQKAEVRAGKPEKGSKTHRSNLTRKLSHKQNTRYAIVGVSLKVKVNLKKKKKKKKLSSPPTKPGSVHRRIPADQAIPTQHPGAVRRAKQN